MNSLWDSPEPEEPTVIYNSNKALRISLLDPTSIYQGIVGIFDCGDIYFDGFVIDANEFTVACSMTEAKLGKTAKEIEFLDSMPFTTVIPQTRDFLYKLSAMFANLAPLRGLVKFDRVHLNDLESPSILQKTHNSACVKCYDALPLRHFKLPVYLIDGEAYEENTQTLLARAMEPVVPKVTKVRKAQKVTKVPEVNPIHKEKMVEMEKSLRLLSAKISRLESDMEDRLSLRVHGSLESPITVDEPIVNEFDSPTPKPKRRLIGARVRDDPEPVPESMIGRLGPDQAYLLDFISQGMVYFLVLGDGKKREPSIDHKEGAYKKYLKYGGETPLYVKVFKNQFPMIQLTFGKTFGFRGLGDVMSAMAEYKAGETRRIVLFQSYEKADRYGNMVPILTQLRLEE